MGRLRVRYYAGNGFAGDDVGAEEFTGLISQVTQGLQGLSLDKALERRLNEEVPADGPLFGRIAAACKAAVAAGWMCNREAAGIKFGRVVKPGAATHGFSVDVVEMDTVRGPHHTHPNGEIDMIMPLDGEAKFDGRGKGWLVYPPGSAHFPTVTAGKALVLYLLPDGAIEFTKV